MRERALRKLKQNSAFTLMEMLVVVAIIAILAGISFVGVSNLTKSIKMTELDSYAKNVYLEAQYQLAAQEVEGSLSKLYKDFSEEGGLYYDQYNTRKLTQMPADYSAEQYGNYYERIYYFTDRDSIMTSFVPEVSMAEENGHYLMELNPQTGEVYGVFFWEADNEFFQGTASTIYEAIQSMQTVEGDVNNRLRASRSEYEIGYYGGSVSRTTMASDYQLNQVVEVINEEELLVKISYDYTGRMLNYLNGATTLDIDVTIVGEESKATWETKIDILENDFVNLATAQLETGLLLDGMNKGQSFAEITEGTGLIPGENLQVYVETTFKQGDVLIKERSSALCCNSLFESVDVREDVYTIRISSVRHLRNLDEKFYSHEDVSTNVELCNDIDFATGSYAFDEYLHYVGEGKSLRPIDAISPISNTTILENNSNEKKVVVNGNDFVIKNLVVRSDETDASGLFARAVNVEFERVRLEDYSLQAINAQNVGALVGYMYAGKVENCGVYLSTYYTDENGIKQYYNQIYDDTYGTSMDRKYASMCVSGATNVGGLIGAAEATSVSDSYAAVLVIGHTNVGGLIGMAKNQTISSSYASGDVRHIAADGKTIGGLLGYATNVSVIDAFSSGNIYGADIIAGFVGSSTNGNFTNCSSYGEVLNRDGNDEFVGVSAGGMICGNVNNTDGDGTCHYLQQLDYNTSTAFGDSVLAYNYSEFTDSLNMEEIHTTAATFPYDANLLYKSFPFKAVTDTYYGDWPLQYLINTALVYYEKYIVNGNETYGYYSVTTLTDTSEDGGAAGDYVWVLDSLRDEACVEDGYALLTMYHLDSFDYASYQFTDGTDETNSVWKQNTTGSLKIAEEYPEGANPSEYALVLRKQGFISFNAYEKTPGVDEYTVDYTNHVIKDSFITSGMYLYQLPYEFQCTDRYDVYNFYDKFVIYNAFARGNISEEAASVIGGKTVEEAETFFYSPHFAKTAVNPGLDVASNATLKNPKTVFVRSARQLNALGRVPYYWNKEGGAEAMTFLQEVDINFGTYTNGTKLYCGHSYDLMDTSADNEVANQPIGMPDLPGTYCQFRNTYDGNYKQIIDYRQQSNEQFSGLFGEIRDATLKNIFMTVSKPGEGYIRSSHQPLSANSARRAGVGALVGLAYLEGNTIENCAASGYTIEYIVEPMTSGHVQPRGIAVGGLFGMCMSSANNCTATNDVLLTLNSNYNDSNKAVFLGGLAGSFYYGTLSNVYCGGTIDINMSGDYHIYRLRIGGLCPGFMYTARDGEETDSVVYKNFYTYTDVTKEIWGDMNDNLDGNGVFDHFIPSVSRMSWNKGGSGNTECLDEVSVPGGYGAYYVAEMYAYHIQQIPDDSDVWDYFQEHRHGWFGKKHGKTDISIDYADLADVENLKEAQSLTNDDMSHRADEVYPYATGLAEEAYPFPAFNYKMVDGKKVYVHFGDWPLVDGSVPEEPEQPEDSDLGGSLVENGVFQLGYANNAVFASANMKTFDLYQQEDGTYYAKFSFTEEEIAKGDNLYVSSELTSSSGTNYYLSFSQNWYDNMSGSCDCTYSFVAEEIGSVSLEAGKEYIIYIYGFDVEKGTDNSGVTWAIKAVE